MMTSKLMRKKQLEILKNLISNDYEITTDAIFKWCMEVNPSFRITLSKEKKFQYKYNYVEDAETCRYRDIQSGGFDELKDCLVSFISSSFE